MKINKQIGVKIIKMANMDDIVCEVFEGFDANENPVIFCRDVFLVNVLPGNSPATSLMNITPWIPFCKDEFIPIYYDAVITVVSPTASFEEYYISVRNKWKDTEEDEILKSSSERLDDVRGPSDDELDAIEAYEELLQKDKSSIH